LLSRANAVTIVQYRQEILQRIWCLREDICVLLASRLLLIVLPKFRSTY